MLKTVVLAALAAFAIAQPAWADGSSAPVDKTPAPGPGDPIIRDLQAASDKFAANDDAGARTLLLKAIASPSFNGLSSATRHAVLLELAATQVGTNQYQEAMATLKTAATYDTAGASDWSLLLSVAVVLHDTHEQIVDLTTMAERWPTSLSDVDDDTVFTLTDSSSPPPGTSEARFRLLVALHDAHWQPQDPFASADDLWTDLMLGYRRHGQLDKARAVAAEIADPRTLIRLSVDRRFDDLTTDLPEVRDIAGVSDRELAHLRATAAAQPDRLYGVIALSLALIERERPQEALDLIDATLAKVPTDKSAESPFSDPDEIKWVMDRRGMALLRLGRNDEAIAVMRAAARITTEGKINMSQSLNLGGDLAELGRPTEALEVIKDITEKNATPYGAMVAAQVRGCSYAQLHDAAQMNLALDYAKAHIADAPGTVVAIEVCTGDLDLAAKSLIDELNDPKLRRDALALVQNWLEPKVLSDQAREEHRRLRLVRDRPDVQAAINGVGRVGTFPLYSPDDI